MHGNQCSLDYIIPSTNVLITFKIFFTKEEPTKARVPRVHKNHNMSLNMHRLI